MTTTAAEPATAPANRCARGVSSPTRLVMLRYIVYRGGWPADWLSCPSLRNTNGS